MRTLIRIVTGIGLAALLYKLFSYKNSLDYVPMDVVNSYIAEDMKHRDIYGIDMVGW
jgi:hypothetical protein